MRFVDIGRVVPELNANISKPSVYYFRPILNNNGILNVQILEFRRKLTVFTGIFHFLIRSKSSVASHQNSNYS